MELNKKRVLNKIDKFKDIGEIIVIGDIMVDIYEIGNNISKISQEAPVLVLENPTQIIKLGGAGNVLMNLLNLGIHVYPIGVCGDDYYGDYLSEHFRKLNIDFAGVIIDPNSETTEKHRYISNNHQLFRMDKENKEKIYYNMVYKYMKECFDYKIKNSSGVIISDYAKGVLNNENFLVHILKTCYNKDIPVFLDPNPKNELCINIPIRTTNCKINIVTPNLDETIKIASYFDDRIVPKSVKSVFDLEELSGILKTHFKSENVLITLGKDGMFLNDKNENYLTIKAEKKNYFSVVGAGDTVISVYAASYLSGLTEKESCILANLCAGITISKEIGQTISKSDLINEIKN